MLFSTEIHPTRGTHGVLNNSPSFIDDIMFHALMRSQCKLGGKYLGAQIALIAIASASCANIPLLVKDRIDRGNNGAITVGVTRGGVTENFFEFSIATRLEPS